MPINAVVRITVLLEDVKVLAQKETTKRGRLVKEAKLPEEYFLEGARTGSIVIFSSQFVKGCQ